MTSRRIIVLVGVPLGALFLYLAGRSLDLATVADTLKRVHVADIIGVVASVYLYLYFKAYRWRYLIQPLTVASTADLLPAVFAGNAGNLIFPHAGEIARAIVANRRLNVPTSALLASIAVERIFDFLMLLLIALVVLLPVGRMSPDMLLASYVIGALAVVILSVAVAFIMWTEGCLRIVQWMLTPFGARVREGILRQLRAGTSGLISIARPELFVPILLLSLLQWLMVIACVAFSIAAVDVSVSIASATSVLVLNVIGLTLPAAPGHVGTVQLAFSVALVPFGVAHADAFAASVIYTFCMIATAIAFGLPSLHKAGMKVRRLLETDDHAGRRP
ncbi:MAG: flippase-like domain-containing protein [Gammaproteobacteria bacterium]|nr:flippase-like domain-containing protein [Gammaproteobacteria bacterium]